MDAKTMRGEMLALLSDLDDGTGDLGVVVDIYLAEHPADLDQHPSWPADEVRQIVVDAREEAAAEEATTRSAV